MALGVGNADEGTGDVTVGSTFRLEFDPLEEPDPPEEPARVVSDAEPLDAEPEALMATTTTVY